LPRDDCKWQSRLEENASIKGMETAIRNISKGVVT